MPNGGDQRLWGYCYVCGLPLEFCDCMGWYPAGEVDDEE